MSNQKPLNVGLVGYGFMGRTHSNAYGKVNQFFDLDRRPVLKAVCGRNESNVKAFAERWGAINPLRLIGKSCCRAPT